MLYAEVSSGLFLLGTVLIPKELYKMRGRGDGMNNFIVLHVPPMPPINAFFIRGRIILYSISPGVYLKIGLPHAGHAFGCM